MKKTQMLAILVLVDVSLVVVGTSMIVWWIHGVIMQPDWALPPIVKVAASVFMVFISNAWLWVAREAYNINKYAHRKWRFKPLPKAWRRMLGREFEKG